jgi:hypothetical protein
MPIVKFGGNVICAMASVAANSDAAAVTPKEARRTNWMPRREKDLAVRRRDARSEEVATVISHPLDD